ncbi:transposase [Paenibacillus validus]|uniref:transposase n=1 Tax=Paenibacillus TaxID=44249 RepID=UPI000FDBC0AE|nr:MULTISPECIES: transposase [Paenibacillus]MED4600228.1 transposase [Paenibacillus validus]MED4605229.1 transposase [Paenibacillus validus]
MQRRRFTLEFKQQIIQEAKEVGNASQVARRHNLNPKVLYRWMNEADHTDWQQTEPSAKTIKAYVPSPQEFRSLEGENKQLKELLGEKDLEIAVLRGLLKKQNPAYRTKLK